MQKNISRTRNSFLNMSTGIGSQLVTSILHFFTRTIFIQTLGVSYLGIGGLFTNILSLLSLTELGLDTAINYKLYKPIAVGDEKRVRLLMKFYKQAYIVIGLTILALGILTIPLLPLLIKDYAKLDELGINAPLVFILYLLQSVSSYLFFAYRTTIIKTAQKTYVLNVVDFFTNIVTSIVQVAVLIFTKDFLFYISIIIIFNLVRNIVNAVISQRMFPYAFDKEEETITKEERNGIFKDCGALFVYKISGVVQNASGNLILSAFIGLAAVGLYSNYLLLTKTINTLLGHFYVGVKASLGNVYAKEGIAKSYFMFEMMNFMTILLKGTAGVGVAVCTNELISVWIGSEYTIPQPLPLLLGIHITLGGLKTNLAQIRNITGAFRQAWLRPVWGSILNIVIAIILCPRIGIIGIVIAIVVSDIFANLMIDPGIIYRVSFKNYKPVSEYYKKNSIYLIVLLLIGIFDYYLCALITTPYPIIDLVLHCIICCLSVPLIFIGVYYQQEECKYVTEKVFKLKRTSR